MYEKDLWRVKLIFVHLFVLHFLIKTPFFKKGFEKADIYHVCCCCHGSSCQAGSVGRSVFRTDCSRKTWIFTKTCIRESGEGGTSWGQGKGKLGARSGAVSHDGAGWSSGPGLWFTKNQTLFYLGEKCLSGQSFRGYMKRADPPFACKLPKSQIVSFLFAAGLLVPPRSLKTGCLSNLQHLGCNLPMSCAHCIELLWTISTNNLIFFSSKKFACVTS